MNKIILVRHGESLGNINPEYWKSEEINFLTRRGMLQAELAGETLKRTGITIDQIFCSPYLRAKHTCTTLIQAAGLTPDFVIVDDLRERHYSSHKELPNVETEEDLNIRAAKISNILIEKLKEGNILCVSHYFIMRSIMPHLGHEWKSPMGWNASLNIIEPFGDLKTLSGNIELHNSQPN